jgi:hypothetical protein
MVLMMILSDYLNLRFEEINRMKNIIAYTFTLLFAFFINACDSTEPTIDEKQTIDSLNTKVNFNSKLNVGGKVADLYFGGTISTYGSTAIAQQAGSTQLQRLKDLKLDGYRIPLKWNNGNIVSSAVGGPQDISGDIWISKLKEIGGEIVIVIGGNANDNNINPKDAANMVRYFKETGTPVKEWIIGNEPSMNGLSIQQYCVMFNQVSDAMKSVDPTIKLGGPAWAWYDLNTLRSFIKLSGTRADIIDYHHYGMGEFYLSDEEAMLQTRNYESEVKEIRNMIKTELPGAENKI